MNGREWKPGDVAMRTYFGKSKRTTLVGGCNEHNELGPHWHHFGGGWDILSDDDGPTYRPLVVIDPEDAEQVERLLASLSVRGWEVGEAESHDDMAIALREFANPTPPKPAEPTALGAVVEDADGERWVRGADVELGGGVWLRELFIGGGSPLSKQYAAVNAVRVLSEGVTQ